jgi:hypothetical protein
MNPNSEMSNADRKELEQDLHNKCTACGKKTGNPRHRNGHPLCIGCKNKLSDLENHGFEYFYRRLSEKVRQYNNDSLTQERLQKEHDTLLSLVDEVQG